MLFRAFKIYRDTKKGVNDPTGFAFEQAQETMLGIVIMPVVIFVAILILLGLMGFTDLIVHASGIARTFFWILLVIGVVFGVPLYIIAVFVNKLFKRGEDLVRPHVVKIKTKVTDAVRNIDS